MSEQTVVEKAGRIPATALFNKINGELISVSSLPIEESQHNPDYYIARSVMFDFSEPGDVIEGKLVINDDGSITDAFKVLAEDEKTPVVYETQLNAMAASKITSKYPVTDQLNILVACVNKLGELNKLTDSKEFEALNEMIDYVNYCLQVNKTKKEYYANDPTVNYITDQQAAETHSRQMEGGVHEEIGPRIVTGGRIWS